MGRFQVQEVQAALILDLRTLGSLAHQLQLRSPRELDTLVLILEEPCIVFQIRFGLLPLLNRAVLLEVLADYTCAGTTGKGGEDERSESEVTVWEGLTGDASGGPVDDSLRTRTRRQLDRADSMKPIHTRLWSIISAITAIWPS